MPEPKVDLRLPKERSISNPAPVWKRILSFFIDLFIIEVIILSPFSAAIQNKLPLTSDFNENLNFFTNNPQVIDQLYLIFGIIFFLVFAYFTIFEYRLRQTPGKMVFGLYLAPAVKGDDISIFRIVVRNLAAFPVFILSLLWVIDPLYLIFTGKRLSDSLSKTLIVEEIRI